MKLGIHTETTNRHFQKALRRINSDIENLKRQLATVDTPGRFGNVMLTFFDDASSVLRVTTRGRNDDIYEVDVGYNYDHNYPPEDDVLVIQLIEEKLKAVAQSDDEFLPYREKLLQLITDWTTDAIGA